MAKVITTHILDDKVVKQEHEITCNGFAVIVHQQGFKVDVPEFVEVDPQDTIKCMAEMSQVAWEWISEGKIFRSLWKESFEPCDHVDPPKSIEIFNLGDMGFRHIAGMIVMGCEACMEGRSVFFRNPETYLHPKTERCIVGMLKKMLDLFNKSGKIKVKGYTKKDGTKVEEYERKATPRKSDPQQDVIDATNWLKTLEKHYGSEKEIFSANGERITISRMTNELFNNTNVAIAFVKQFIKLRDE